jgi:hypothetical protein
VTGNGGKRDGPLAPAVSAGCGLTVARRRFPSDRMIRGVASRCRRARRTCSDSCVRAILCPWEGGARRWCSRQDRSYTPPRPFVRADHSEPTLLSSATGNEVAKLLDGVAALSGLTAWSAATGSVCPEDPGTTTAFTTASTQLRPHNCVHLDSRVRRSHIRRRQSVPYLSSGQHLALFG